MTETIKNSGAEQQFETGSRRDLGEGKSRPDLISPFLKLRLGKHMMLGALRYSHWNWAKGQPNSRYRESLERHLMLADMGLVDEDHWAAALFNLMGIVHNQEMKKLGWLRPELDDWPLDWRAHSNGGDARMNTGGGASKEVMERYAKAAQEYVNALYAMMQDMAAPK